MSGESGISRVVVAAVGAGRLVSLVQRGCATVHGSAGHRTIVYLSTRVERIAVRYSPSEAWLPVLTADDLVASRVPAMAEALLLCPSTMAVDFEILVDWTPRSVLRAVLRVSPDAVVVDRGLPLLRRLLRPHFALRAGRGESDSRALVLMAASRTES